MRADALGRATPTLNALARRGLRFENCYCAATLCSPSRNSIITGLFPGQHGVCGNMGEPIVTELRADTYARHLQELGYHTAYVGKHHYIDRSGLEYDLVEDDRLLREYGYHHVWQVGDVVDARHGADRFTRHLADRGLLEEWRSKLGAEYVAGSDPADTTDGYIGESAVRYLQSYEGRRTAVSHRRVRGPARTVLGSGAVREPVRAGGGGRAGGDSRPRALRQRPLRRTGPGPGGQTGRPGDGRSVPPPASRQPGDGGLHRPPDRPPSAGAGGARLAGGHPGGVYLRPRQPPGRSRA